MAEFIIYHHPVRGHQAVKVGFCWPAFFFDLIWLLFCGMWGWALLGLGGFFLIGVWVDSTASSMQRADDMYTAATVILGFPLKLILGFQGNDIRRRKLLGRGFSKVGKVRESSKAYAIKLHLHEKNKADEK
ncbi:MAG: DUF2628 domain-containing protein [Gammaproteobacteria bacterium]